MPHLHTKPGGHDLTASAYIVRLDTPEPTIYLHRHKKLKTYLQFGGHVEHNENPWEALTHELVEESGYTLDQLSLLQPATRLTKLTGVTLHPTPVCMLTHKFEGMDHYHDDIAFAFTTTEPPRHAIADGESADIKLFTAAQLRVLSADEIPENAREIALFILEECLTNWRSVPCSKL